MKARRIPSTGPARDAGDRERVRHGRDRHVGFPVGRYAQPAPMLFTRDGHNVFLGDLYRGRSAFLLCGGPSLTSHDLTKLDRRGILTCAVNNAAIVRRPNLWVCVDDPGNFCDVIWRDPAILKFVPLCHMEKKFSIRGGKGELVESAEVVGDMPAVLGFRRNERFLAEQWLYEDTFNWGNHGDLVDAHGVKGSRSVMLPAVRLLFFLGVRTVYLAGCDFRMAVGEKNYAFDQDRSRGSVKGNNKTYEALNVRFQALLPFFEQEGFEVFNCTPESGLTPFPYLDFDEAVERATAEMPKRIDTTGMYDRKTREKSAAAAAAAAAPKTEATPDPQPARRRARSVPATAAVASPEPPADDPALPPLTLVTCVDKRNCDPLVENWPKWMEHRSLLRGMRKVVLVAEGERLCSSAESFLREQADVEVVPVAAGPASEGRDRWTTALFRDVAVLVQTPWYVRIEPEAVTTGPETLWKPEWLEPDEAGRLVKFVAAPWGYTKPADAFDRLDDWGDEVPGLREFPRLHVPFDPTADRVRHDAVSSWLFFARTDWTREVTAYLGSSKPPVGAHDTLAWYLARRRGEGYRRVPLKRHGWDHSFARSGGCRCRKSEEKRMTAAAI